MAVPSARTRRLFCKLGPPTFALSEAMVKLQACLVACSAARTPVRIVTCSRQPPPHLANED